MNVGDYLGKEVRFGKELARVVAVREGDVLELSNGRHVGVGQVDLVVDAWDDPGVALYIEDELEDGIKNELLSGLPDVSESEPDSEPVPDTIADTESVPAAGVGVFSGIQITGIQSSDEIEGVEVEEDSFPEAEVPEKKVRKTRKKKDEGIISANPDTGERVYVDELKK